MRSVALMDRKAFASTVEAELLEIAGVDIRPGLLGPQLRAVWSDSVRTSKEPGESRQALGRRRWLVTRLLRVVRLVRWCLGDGVHLSFRCVEAHSKSMGCLAEAAHGSSQVAWLGGSFLLHLYRTDLLYWSRRGLRRSRRRRLIRALLVRTGSGGSSRREREGATRPSSSSTRRFSHAAS